MLLSTSLFGENTAAQAHVRWLPFLERVDELGRYSWGPQSLPGCTGVYAEQPTGMSSRWWERYLPTFDEKGPRLQAHRRQLDLMPFREFFCLSYRTKAVEAVLNRSILPEDHKALWCSIVPLIYFRTIEWHQVDRVIPQFGGVQNRPHAALNIDFMHAKDGWGSDQWFPQTYQCWHGFWATSLLILAPLQTSLSGGSSPLGGTLSRLGLTTTTWEENDGWDEDEMMAEDASAERSTRKIRRMLEGYGRRRGAGRGGRDRREGCDMAPTQQTLASPSQPMLYGLSSPGFQQMISKILLEGDGGYRPDTQFDGSPIHLDLNEPVSGPSHMFMALGGTPPSAAHVPSGSWVVPFMEPARSADSSSVTRTG
ncbi:hypothetical protein PIB30_040136 [Stylosanthes scabra]|uniref:Aminotransferase-like plant mobile domain-containing protein n=1 Tax=Stylosanthes scabra TaxID=79078 RepID=A0ABU6TGK2_9FABA|nr:hypothetical protein [Stylosanthes scabra]